MDPNQNIKRQRELVAEIVEGRYEDLTALADDLAFHVQALMEWRLKGGFDPYVSPVCHACGAALYRNRVEHDPGGQSLVCVESGANNPCQCWKGCEGAMRLAIITDCLGRTFVTKSSSLLTGKELHGVWGSTISSDSHAERYKKALKNKVGRKVLFSYDHVVSIERIEVADDYFKDDN